MTEATWRQAMDNVRDGEIRLEDNHPFTATGFYYGINHTYFESTPSIKLEVNTSTNTVNQNYINFKDGSKFGIEYLGTDNNKIYYKTFIYFPGYPVIGTTTEGTEYTWAEDGEVIATFTYIDTIHGPLTMSVDRMALSFGMMLNSDGSIDLDSYTLKEVIYPTSAHAGNYPWLPIGDALPDDCTTYGTFGYPEANSHIVDWLCGQNSPPAQYPGDPTGTGGGGGTFYDDNYYIGFAGAPGISAISLGFNTIYTPDYATMQTISHWLWSDDFDEAIKLNYINPFDNIVALAIVPIYTPPLSTNSYLRVGNVDSNISCSRLQDNQQYQWIDCGTLDITEKWGSFLDYNATYMIYLPFIGYRSLKPDDMTNGKITVGYWADLLTGMVAAQIMTMVKKPDGSDGIWHVLYSYTGNMMYNMAFSGANFATMYQQQLSATASGINSAIQGVSQLMKGDYVGGASSLIMGGAQAHMQKEMARPDYGRGGNNSGNAGMFLHRIPYIIQVRPDADVPANYRQLQGVPSQTYFKLSDLTGYTEIDSIIVNTLTCTEEEQTQIIAQLKEGVIL